MKNNVLKLSVLWCCLLFPYALIASEQKPESYTFEQVKESQSKVEQQCNRMNRLKNIENTCEKIAKRTGKITAWSTLIAGGIAGISISGLLVGGKLSNFMNDGPCSYPLWLQNTGGMVLLLSLVPGLLSIDALSTYKWKCLLPFAVGGALAGGSYGLSMFAHWWGAKFSLPNLKNLMKDNQSNFTKFHGSESLTKDEDKAQCVVLYEKQAECFRTCYDCFAWYKISKAVINGGEYYVDSDGIVVKKLGIDNKKLQDTIKKIKGTAPYRVLNPQTDSDLSSLQQ